MLQAERSNFGYLARRLDRAVEQLVHRHFCHFSPSETWIPAINAYRLPDRIEVCVDLAGVAKDSIDIQAQPGELIIRGLRTPPQPEHEPDESIEILAMEIDHGPFQRIVRLPASVDIAGVSASSDEGLLWIRLPLAAPTQSHVEPT
ncbi:MAG: Hsp20/alpha crystallin family protein [Phycisphaeraceae bacterium]